MVVYELRTRSFAINESRHKYFSFLPDEEAVEQMYEDIGIGLSLKDDDCGHYQGWKATWKEELLPVASHLLSLLNKSS